MTNKELQEKLRQFPDDLDVVDSGFNDIETIREATWVDTNYPYNLPDKQVIMII